MLNEQTVEKLHAMKLFGMAEAFRTQMETAAAGSLGFEERFALTGGSAMDLAREPGPGAAPASRQAEGTRGCGGHQLSASASAGSQTDAVFGEQ